MKKVNTRNDDLLFSKFLRRRFFAAKQLPDWVKRIYERGVIHGEHNPILHDFVIETEFDKDIVVSLSLYDMRRLGNKFSSIRRAFESAIETDSILRKTQDDERLTQRKKQANDRDQPVFRS